jgi:hypothetical protein
MSNQKLARVDLGREGPADTVRYVPLEILGLWSHLMAERHGFQIKSFAASVWAELEDGAGVETKTPTERVTEISLYYFDPKVGMLNRICRYAPSEDLPLVREALLRHYGALEHFGNPKPWMRERQGVWFRPREAAASEIFAEAGAETTQA